jgi:uncharacterized protein YidB (DUF937 family)
MGLLDVLNGMQNGPRGGEKSGGTSNGMSPLTMGLLALLAYKALKSSGILGTDTSTAQTPTPSPQNLPPANTPSAGSDWLTGLQRVIAGGGAGGILSAGLNELVKRLQQSGQGQAARSWVEKGTNETVAPEDLEKAIGTDTLDTLAERIGVPRDRILTELKAMLPSTVDTMTPDGRLPDEKEAARWG